MNPHLCWSQIAKYLAIALFMAICVVAPTQANTEAPVEKGIIFVDGHRLFEVGSSGNFSASERAERVTDLLQDLLSNSNFQKETINVQKIPGASGLLTLRVNGRYLLSVTPADIDTGMPLIDQANIWQQKLEAALERAIYQRQPPYQRWALRMSLVSLAIAFLASTLLHAAIRWVRRQRVKQSPQENRSLSLLLLHLGQFLTWLGAVGYIAYLFPSSRRWLSFTLTFTSQVWEAEALIQGEQGISLKMMAIVLVLALLLWVGTDHAVKLFKSRILPTIGVDRALQDAIGFFARYALLFVGLLLGLSAFGVDFTSLIVVFGFLGVGIGFGLQNIAKDFISGMLMIVEQPIKVGELVEVGGIQGLVQHIGARTTEVVTIERSTIFIPNSRFIEGEVWNWHRSGLARVQVHICVVIDTERDQVHRLLLIAAQEYHADILRYPPPKVRFSGYKDGGLSFYVIVFIRDPLKELKVRAYLYEQIDTQLRGCGIKIAFPDDELQVKLPRLESLLEAWLKQQGISNGNMLKFDPLAVCSATDPSQCHPHPQTEVFPLDEEYDWEGIVSRMRGPSGLDIRDRRHRFQLFPKCFVGTEAVQWLMEQEKATRAEAIAIGRLLVALGIIHHVLDEHSFRDDHLFYRFYMDETDPALKEISQSKRFAQEQEACIRHLREWN
ncbi:MAG: mechanosensitive ion channel [Chloroflexaceae bacterium]|nr:mechanosensitive ion channel [Chloroflexaceae bacterium]